MSDALDIILESYNGMVILGQLSLTASIPVDCVEGKVARVFQHAINSRPADGTILSTAFLSTNDSLMFGFQLPVVIKTALGAERITALRREATLYQTRLCDLQGNVVPRFLGLYEGESGGFFGDEEIACMLLEYCPVAPQGMWLMSPTDYACVISPSSTTSRYTPLLTITY